jgi:hypothetical protein
VTDRASLVPDLPQINADIHLVLCDFGKLGRAYVETDPDHADEASTVRNMLEGTIGRYGSSLLTRPRAGAGMFPRTSPEQCFKRHRMAL